MSDNTVSQPADAHICPHQFAFILDNFIRKLVQRPAKILGEYLQEGYTAIDVGCGPGFFSIDMAKMVGPHGKVIAADLQPKMLARVAQKAVKHGVADRLTAHQCEPDRIGIEQQADFILAYYMVHETPSPRKFFKEMQSVLKPSGKLLVVEPRMHVKQAAFDIMVSDAQANGWQAIDFPKGKGGRAVVFVPKNAA